MSPRAQSQGLAFDPKLSSASFTVHLRIAMPASGQFAGVTGELREEATQRRVLVTVDARSLSFDGPAWMKRITRSDSFLAVDRYPEISFRSQAFDPALLTSGGQLHGELLLRGRRRQVAFEMLAPSCAQPGRDCDILVRGTVRRRDFGMNAYRFSVKDGVDFLFRVRLQAGTPP